jgi:hypothetical protein
MLLSGNRAALLTALMISTVLLGVWWGPLPRVIDSASAMMR